MNKLKVELNSEGIQELLKSNEMHAILTEYAANVAQQAGAGYTFAVHEFHDRAGANVYPDTPEASRDNYENNTLLKVIGS